MKGAIEKEELRGRINKILKDEIGRELLDMTADKIIDVIFGENLPNPQEPRVGQICDLWDGVDKKGLHVSVLVCIGDMHPRYMDQQGEWWGHARVLRDPLTLGKTQAPEGAEWIAPWSQDVWAFFGREPNDDSDGYFTFGDIFRNSYGHVQTFPAPTDGGGPIKLWED